MSGVEILKLGDFTNSVTIGGNSNAANDAANFNSARLTIDDSAAGSSHPLTFDAHTFDGTGSNHPSVNVIGGAGNDSIIGSPHNDTISGGLGADVLIGGGGSDTFVYRTAADSQPGAGAFDTITDFVSGTDRLDFSAISGISSIQGPVSAGTTINAHSIAWVVSNGQIIDIYANISNNGTMETAGGTGSHTPDMQIHLTNVTTLQVNSDFILHG